MVFNRFLVGFVWGVLVLGVQGEAMIQYFNTEYRVLAQKMPELAEVGYDSIWLPPPTKGSGGLSVGYDLWDRFDLGSKDQRNTIRTLYGTEGDLLYLIEVAHRFGIRIYFDNIMNHNAFDIPGFNESTPIDLYPGFVAEDFHLRRTEDGFYRKWDNTRSWGDAWQVMNLGLADLIDIAHENPNTNHGENEGDDFPKYFGVRQADHPEYYRDTDLPFTVNTPSGDITVYHFANKEAYEDVGCTNCPVDSAGNGRFDWDDVNGNGQHEVGEASEPFTDTGLNGARPDFLDVAHGFGDGVYNMGNPTVEDVNSLLIRSAQWLLDRTYADGLRLDAVKHVPDYFFGQQSGGDKDYSNVGYMGGAQEQFNLVRGFSDWNNHRDSVFNTEQGRDDAMMFGEHLGSPPGTAGYVDAGMRLVDNDLRSFLNGSLAFGDINGLRFDGAGGFGSSVAVMHAQSHDNDFVTKRELQHAIYFTRTGLPLIYTDGNYHAETLGESGGAFPRHANTTFLGQFGDPSVPNIMYIHEQFARGSMFGFDTFNSNMAAYERRDGREGHGSAGEQVTMLFMLNKDGGSGHGYPGGTGFPSVSGGENAYLYNYSYHGGGFYTWASDLHAITVPSDGYFVFSYRVPEASMLWKNHGGHTITLYEDGEPVTRTLCYERMDGPDGDPAFNPLGLPDSDVTDYAYTYCIPWVTNATNIRVAVRADGSTENVLLRLDGGMDLNGVNHAGGDPRDYPPAIATETFMGYEQMNFVHRQHPEKFAGINTGVENQFGSAGAASYVRMIGGGGVTNYPGAGPSETTANTATFVYHDPDNTVGGLGFTTNQYHETATSVVVYVKTDAVGVGYKVFCYYTTDGSFPEGAGGEGAGRTRVIPVHYAHDEASDNWWRGELIPKPSGMFIYKVGVYKDDDGGGFVSSKFPSGPTSVEEKVDMMTVFELNNLDFNSLSYRPHLDYSVQSTGLVEGFHILRAREFLDRGPGSAKPGVSLYNTDKLVFYFDKELPQGVIKFPGPGSTIGGPNQSEYEVVVRTDATVTEVFFNIEDGDAANDDFSTERDFGNGVNTNSVTNWVSALSVSPNPTVSEDCPEFPLEWRFRYRNIPTNGLASIRVKLLELTSSTNLFLSASDAHVTELQRDVTTMGPDRLFRFDFPVGACGEIQRDWVQRILFSPSLGDGFTDEALRESFTMEVMSSGATSGVFHPKLDFTIVRDRGDGVGQLEATFSSVYADGVYNPDNPALCYDIIVTQTNQSGFLSQTTASVKAFPLPPEPFIDIIEPEEVDVVGNRQALEFSSFPTQTLVRVNTDEDALMVWVDVGGEVIPMVATNSPLSLGPDRQQWDFVWTVPGEGFFQIETRMDTDGDTNTFEAVEFIVIEVEKVQLVAEDAADRDDDDDGISDTNEVNHVQLTGNTESFTSAQVHEEFAFGRTKALGPDTDGDGLPDGLELGFRSPASVGTNDTDLAADTDGDGLPDGWELTYAFNALDNGTDDYGTTNLNDGVVENGASGDPDNDLFDNLTELINGTHPRVANTNGPVNGKAIFIGAGPEVGTLNGVTYFEEFRDWTKSDLLMLDEYEGNGNNNQGGDVYQAYDGFDSSRDIVAFYFRDGGSVTNGGTGSMYFRLDFLDLQAFAEEGHLDMYVVIDSGQPTSGERALPDDVDIATDMRWEAVVSVYDSLNGRIYVDGDATNNTTDAGQDLVGLGGVQIFDQSSTPGFQGAYFNAELDAVEFAIDRAALLPPFGLWNGVSNSLNFQVFVTRDGTCNGCNDDGPGDGDIGGRNDIRDTIYDDFMAEDHWKRQKYISENGVLEGFFGLSSSNDRGKYSKVGMVMHGNQHLQPGSVMQELIDNNAGSGYTRMLNAHDVFKQKVNLHVTPTFASAVEWAKADPAAGVPWRDGPAMNDLISTLMQSNLVHLMGSTYSDHMLPYFDDAYNIDNNLLARDVLQTIYGVSPSDLVFWTPERLSNDKVLSKVSAMGYTHSFVDQGRHITKWFGRTSALGNDGYRINEVGPVDCFVINDFASGFLFKRSDGGLNLPLRQLFNRKARSGTQDQIVTLFTNWEAFHDKEQADAYEANLRWMANHPWVQLVSLHEVATDQVDLSRPPNGAGDVFGVASRVLADATQLVAQDFIDHATQENYDHWYFSGSSSLEEGLSDKVFHHIPGFPLPLGYGVQDSLSPGGVVHDSWTNVQAMVHTDVKRLARSVLHASTFETAFHTQKNNNLIKFSTGDYIELDDTLPFDYESVIDFARYAQAQTRHASLFREVDAWAMAPPGTAVAVSKDVDLDGNNEMLLYNDRVFAVMENIGGRMTAAFLRDPSSGRVFQMLGNFAGFSGSDSEFEGNENADTGGVVDAFRTSGLKDWFADDGGSGTRQYVNDVYLVGSAPGPNPGWTFLSPDGKVSKTVTLWNTNDFFDVSYTLSGLNTLYVRNGLNPNLDGLFSFGQQHLGALQESGSILSLTHSVPGLQVQSRLVLGGGATYISAANDDNPAALFDTLNMRNQAQTHQVELAGSGTFFFSLGFSAATIDSDLDGLPDAVENQHTFLNPNDPSDVVLDGDGDGASNLDEYLAGTGIGDANDTPIISSVEQVTDVTLEFPSKSGRLYEVWYKNDSLISSSLWQNATPTPIAGDGGVKQWTDDGSTTSPHPSNLPFRVYQLRIMTP